MSATVRRVPQPSAGWYAGRGVYREQPPSPWVHAVCVYPAKPSGGVGSEPPVPFPTGVGEGAEPIGVGAVVMGGGVVPMGEGDAPIVPPPPPPGMGAEDEGGASAWTARSAARRARVTDAVCATAE